MILKSNSLSALLVKLVVAIPLLFLCTVPLFYAMAVFWEVPGIVYLSARILRLLLIVAMAYAIGKSNQEMIHREEPRRRKLLLIAAALAFVSFCLLITGISGDFYWSVSSRAGILAIDAVPIRVIIWEQMLAGDMYWTILLSVLLVLFRRPRLQAAET